MNGHRRMETSLRALLDGDLPEDRAASVEAHVRDCESCSRERDRREEVEALLRTARPGVDPMPADLAHAVFHQALAQSGVTPRRWTRTPLLTLGFGAAAALCAGVAVVRAGVGLPRSRPGSAPVTVAEVAPQPAARPQEALKKLESAPAPAPRTQLVAQAPERPARPSRTRRRPARWLADASAPAHLSPDVIPGTSDLGALAAGSLVVTLTAGGHEPLVKASEAAPDAPGYARVATVVSDADGRLAWSQSVVSSDRTSPELTLIALQPDAAACETSPQLENQDESNDIRPCGDNGAGGAPGSAAGARAEGSVRYDEPGEHVLGPAPAGPGSAPGSEGVGGQAGPGEGRAGDR